MQDLSIREITEQNEHRFLSSFAAKSDRPGTRERPESPCSIRTAFQRDRDRIIHSKAFRRLKHKTQVFLSPEDDHYRTRLTHTLEVSQVARTIARALRLNEDLTEAIALGHDIGHTPFGHAGEKVLNDECPLGFMHNQQSVRVLKKLENGGKGQNLTSTVLNGILCHTGKTRASTPEGQIVHYADRIAYINHDIDDAVRSGILKLEDIPKNITESIGKTHSERISAMIYAIISRSDKKPCITMQPETENVMNNLRDFLFDRVYHNSIAKAEEDKAMYALAKVYRYFVKNPDKLPEEFIQIKQKEGTERAVLDYVAGMTDRYAAVIYKELFVPSFWFC